MRLLFALALFLLPVSASNAAVYQLPLGGAVQVYGDFVNKQIEAYISFSASASIGPAPDLINGPFSGYTASFVVDSLRFYSDGSNQIGGACGPCYVGANLNTPILLYGGLVPGDSDVYDHQLLITGSAGTYGPDVGPLTVNLFVTLPEGYSIFDPNVVAPVPEPSTWAMLLIGFVGIGFVSRKSKRQLARRMSAASPTSHLQVD